MWLGRILGGIVGFAIGVFFTEVVFPNNRETEPLIAVTLLTILGVATGSWLARRRLKSRRATLA